MINQEQKDVLNKYAQIKKDIKTLELLADELNPQALAIMQDNEVEEIAISDLGKLSMGSRRKWTYSLEIIEKEDALKAEKKEAEQTGIGASYVENHYIIFKGNKDE